MSTSSGHDALGRRVFKSNTAVRHFAHDEQRKVIGEYDASSTVSETVWLGSTPIAVLRNGATYWIDADQIDTPRAVLDASNQIVWRWRAEAFGNLAAEEDPSGLGAFEFNHRFPGQMFDKETALHHNDQRDYRAHTGRYIESDPIGLQGGVNRYSYVGSNPISYVDPEGEALSLPGVIVVVGTIYGGYKLYDKFEKFKQEVEACKIQCENTVACGDAARTAMYLDNAARCITTCKANATIGSFFGVGKGPTGPKSPETTPDYFKGLLPADGRP